MKTVAVALLLLGVVAGYARHQAAERDLGRLLIGMFERAGAETPPSRPGSLDLSAALGSLSGTAFAWGRRREAPGCYRCNIDPRRFGYRRSRLAARLSAHRRQPRRGPYSDRAKREPCTPCRTKRRPAVS
jgi:hypothetical protein